MVSEQFPELLDALSLFLVEGGRHFDIDQYHKITTARCTTPAVNLWQAFATDAHVGSRLCSRFDGQLVASAHQRHLCLTSQYGCRIVDVQAIYECRILTLEGGLLLLLDEYEQVSVRSSVTTGMTHAFHIQLHSLLYACWDVDVNNLLLLYQTIATTLLTTGLDLLAGTMAVGTSGLGLHTTEERVHDSYHTARTTALATGLEFGTVLGSCAIAMRTLDVLLELDVLGHSGNDILQAHLDTDAHTLTLLTSRFIIVITEE